MIKLKNLISLAITGVIIFFVVINFDTIKEKLGTILTESPEIVIYPPNEYKRDFKYHFVKQTDDFVPLDEENLKDIYYTVLNNGWSEFTFYCPIEYSSCLDDVVQISQDKELLSNINNFVNPYNRYEQIKTLYDPTGEVTIIVSHEYTDSEIKKIDKDIDKIIEKVVGNEKDNEEKIKLLHDYIINNTKYDSVRANASDDEDNPSPYDSERITGLLYDHYAICSAYTETMAVMLDKLGIPNYMVSSDSHVWNAVYVKGEWKHLDLTWDDPVTKSGKDMLERDYCLITTDKLKSLDTKTKDHIFNKKVYYELK